MLNKYHKFLLKKGLRLAFTNPKSLYYKYKQFKKTSGKKIFFLNHNSINLVNYLDVVIDFAPEIIIPVYNGYEYLVKLVEQLLSHQHITYKIILINDCSTDRRVSEYLIKLIKLKTNHSIRVLSNTINLGFVQTVNRGMKLTHQHFIILNTDTEVPTYFASKILEPIFKNNNIASVTPFTNSGSICSFPVFLQDNPIFLGLDVQTIDDVLGQISNEHNITIPTGVGFCMAINREAYTQISGFDAERFGKGYGEENDWCMRAIKVGYKHLHAVNCFVYHKHGGSFNDIEKQQLIKCNNKILEALHPQYTKLKHKYFAEDPVHDIRLFIKLKLIINNIESVCIFNGVQTGGSNSYIHGLIQSKIKHNGAALLIESKDFMLNSKITVYTNDEEFEFIVSNVFSLLKKLEPKEIMVNHLLFNNNLNDVIHSICKLKNKLDVKLTVILHDYFFLCPSVTLLNYANNYCGLPTDSNICNKCLTSYSSKSYANEYLRLYNATDIIKWRELFFLLSASADNIAAPSMYTINLFAKVYPDFMHKSTVINQDLSYLNSISNELNYIPFKKSKITVAALGNLTKHKGSEVIYSMIKLAKINKLNIEWVILGDIDPFHEVSKLILYRNYSINDLPNLLNKYQPDIFILPSIWPETFCYTASEMMHFNLPIVSFNLGAHAERIVNYARGYLADEITSESMLDKIVEVIQKYSLSQWAFYL